MTLGEAYGPAMEIMDRASADRYLADLVERLMDEGDQRLRLEVQASVRGNLGYYAGYYGEETRERVERLFHCEHPILGRFAVYGSPTSEEAFELDKRASVGHPLTLGELRMSRNRAFPDDCGKRDGL